MRTREQRLELLVFDLKYHLLFNEGLDAVLPRLVEAPQSYAGQPAARAETR